MIFGEKGNFYFWYSLNKKKIASAGNRTRAARVAGEHSTTEPPMLMDSGPFRETEENCGLTQISCEYQELIVFMSTYSDFLLSIPYNTDKECKIIIER